MDNINDLIGDAAKQLMAQADGIQNQKLKASAQRVARTVSAKTRDELISVARSDAYGRDTRFIKYLPITWRQKAVMGRVYSFQCTTNKDGTRRTGSQGNVRRRGFGALSTGLQLQMVVASGSRFLPARQEGITDMDKEIRYFVNGWSFRLSFATRPGYDGDHEDISDGDSYELGEYENSEEALAAAEAFISTHGNEVNDEEDGIGSVIYWTVEVERRVEYKENEWLPCDESGRIDDGYGNEPNATVAYLSSLEGSREERAFELAKNEYLAWLEHKADRYTTVYGYMD